jgi:cell division protein FtsZ
MSESIFNPILFELPKNQSSSIKVIGVGGGGSNAVNYMFSQDINGVDFVICNTDAQALENSPIPNKIQLGADLTEGMGAGANPEIGAKAAQESYNELREVLSTGTKMVFITAGMGGGTGTGAAPIIAKIAKELSLLTVGIVTMPFEFEGKQRTSQAQKGIEKLKEHVDSLIIINNNKLREVYGNLGYKSGFAKADEVLSTAARGIAEVITHHYKHNIDLNDAKTVLSNSGTAIMGSAVFMGADRAKTAIEAALDSPLLNDNKITGAKNVLMLIVSGNLEVTIDEIGEINDHVREEAGNDVNIILGVGDDENLGEAIAVTIIATGFSTGQQHQITNTEVKKIVHTLEDDQQIQFEFDEKPFAKQELNFLIEDDRNDDLDNFESEKTIFQLEEEINPDFLIRTTEVIKNIEVLYDEIGISKIDEFTIFSLQTENKSIASETVNPLHEEIDNYFIDLIEENSKITNVQNQMSLDFDLPAKQEEKFYTSEEIKEIKVKDAELFHFENNNEVIYNLSDFEEKKVEKKSQQPVSGLKKQVIDDIELQFELKTQVDLFSKPIQNKIKTDDEESLSPLNASIEEFMKTTDMRKSFMKQHNYNFHQNNGNIDEYENEPAYKRMNIELNESTDIKENQRSRTSVDFDENGIKLRSNNSFLHDNVD